MIDTTSQIFASEHGTSHSLGVSLLASPSRFTIKQSVQCCAASLSSSNGYKQNRSKQHSKLNHHQVTSEDRLSRETETSVSLKEGKARCGHHHHLEKRPTCQRRRGSASRLTKKGPKEELGRVRLAQAWERTLRRQNLPLGRDKAPAACSGGQHHAHP